MNNRRITNRDELHGEIMRLKELSAKQEEQLLSSVKSIGENLKPENLLLRILSSITGINIDKNEFMKNGVLIGISLVAQRFLFKKEIELERKIYGWVDTVFDKVRYYVHKFSSTRSERVEQQD